MRLILVVCLSVVAASASAACKDDISQMESAARAKLKSSIQKSTGGQGEAARREATEEEHNDGDDAMQAKVALNDARVASDKGDEAACQTALQKARKRIDHQ